eukprot:gene12450-6202_t
MTNYFDKTQFTVHFESVFTNKKMGNAFKGFLETEHNLEHWHFLEAVKALESVTSSKEKTKKTKEIVEKYIRVDSKEEINISGDTREFIINEFKKQENNDEWVLDLTPSELFANSYNLVVTVLSHDSFKRFVRTVECEAIMKQCKHDSTVISPLITKNFDFGDEFFTHPHFRDRDFDFFLSLFQDSYNWKLFGSKAEENMNAFFGTSNFLPDLKLAKTVRASKLECILPCTFDQALISFFDNEQIYKSDPFCGKYETDEYYTYEQLLDIFKKNGQEDDIIKYKRDLSVNSMALKLPFPLNSRVANYSLSGYYDEKNELFMRVGKSFLPDVNQFCKKGVQAIPPKRGAKPKKTTVYSIFILSAGLYKKIDNNRVFFQEISISDLAGWIAAESLYKKVAIDRKNKFRSQLLELAREYPQDAKIKEYKEKLSELVDGKTNGLGKILINTVELNSEDKKEQEMKNEIKNEEEMENDIKNEIKEDLKEEISIIDKENKIENSQAIESTEIPTTKKEIEVKENEESIEIKQEVKEEIKEEETKEEIEIIETENEDVKEEKKEMPMEDTIEESVKVELEKEENDETKEDKEAKE